jgi:hypothetical protein
MAGVCQGSYYPSFLGRANGMRRLRAVSQQKREFSARENSKIVILIYESSPKKNQAINEIIAPYKRTFQQESVLPATSEEPVSF